MSGNLTKKNKRFFTKKIRKICVAVLILLLSGTSILYILTLFDDFKENQFNNVKDDYVEEENNNQQSENNESDSDEKLFYPPDIKTEIPVDNTNVTANKILQIENRCKKYASFISNFLVLQEKIMIGRGFAQEINELKSFNISDKEIKNIIHELSFFAEVGVPNFLNLRDQFNSMGDNIIRIYQLENENSKFRKKALKFFQELIFIKKVGERAIKKGGIEGTIQNIKNFLEDEQVPEAILEAKKITNTKVKDLVDSWVSDCEKYLKLQELYENFKKQTLEKMNCSSFVND